MIGHFNVFFVQSSLTLGTTKLRVWDGLHMNELIANLGERERYFDSTNLNIEAKL